MHVDVKPEHTGTWNTGESISYAKDKIKTNMKIVHKASTWNLHKFPLITAHNPRLRVVFPMFR